jgi:hypothetical protein
MSYRAGPWHVSEHRDGMDALVYDADGFEVAKVCHPNRNDTAYLIAAAPEILEALETLTEHFEYYMGDNECRPIENAHSAIAKARLRNADM